MRVIIVGAGLAGLTCVKVLSEKNVEASIFEASDGVGAAELSDGRSVADFRPLAVCRVPYCQFAQPPGVHTTLPGNRTETPGLFLAGEYTEDSSINGSMLSGEKAAMEAMRG